MTSPSHGDTSNTTGQGPNSWFIDELYQQYLDNPRSVPEPWQDIFAQGPPGTVDATTPAEGRTVRLDSLPPDMMPPPPPPAPPAPGATWPTTSDATRSATSTVATSTPVASAAAASTAASPAVQEAVPAAAPTASPPVQPSPPATAPIARATKPPAAARATPKVAATDGKGPTDGDGETGTAEDGEAQAESTAEVLRGVSALIASNMESSLEVPTATSFREVPAKLLEVNRTILNNHLRRVRGGKVSFTHIIGYAVVKAITSTVPNLNNTFRTNDDGKPELVRNRHVNLGIAVDMEKEDGSRTLMVPVIKKADTLDFSEFVDGYEALIDKVRNNKMTVDDLTGATVTLTNPGTIGTVQSVPRLMKGQGAIIGVGRIGFPTEYQAADPKMLAHLGISKIIAITSTYDHRIIQGAESGLFLKKVHELLLGEDDFYTQAFADVGVPYEAVKWRVDHGATDAEDGITGQVAKQLSVNTLINQYRVRGHLIANTNPLADKAKATHAELDPATYGLTIWDLDREFLTGAQDGIYASIGGQARMMKLGDILGVLRDAYCRAIGVEYMHIADPDEKRWIQEQVEGSPISFDRDQQMHILERLSAAEALERFLHTRYVGQKRFGIEGTESAIPILDALLSAAADEHLERAVLGMAHRGRLNVLVNIMGKRYQDLFSEFEGTIDENAIQGSGDVKYHLGQVGKHTSPDGNQIGIELAANPSHLEAVDPVVVGMSRAYMDQSTSGNYPVLPILIHGDAAFAGQGVVTETLNLSQVRGYKVGGTVHLIINNQLGYTTAPHQSRSSEYSTDVAKTVQAPIFHVNADDPEACVRVAKLAFDYRQQFNKDVVIDMIGYRRFGHNEGDDPSYTQPVMYRKIADRPSARTLYTQALIDRGDLTTTEAEEALEDFGQMLQNALDLTRGSVRPDVRAKPAPPAAGVLPHVDTGVARQTIDHVFETFSAIPDDFTVHPKLARQLQARKDLFAGGQVDWAIGEALAIGTLLAEGTSVRLAGQDSRRGTFAHRHATLHDYNTGAEYTPLTAVAPVGVDFWVYDSTLSEYAGLGFEYGYSVANPHALVLWEAQFGDFVNGAQIIIDQFLVAAEDKWNQTVNLVMLLPHGYEGQGPEHSSGRLERFLLLCADDNIQVANVTTAAQLFHLLRRQVVRTNSKPLVLFTPKSLLRAKSSRSPIEALTRGSFEEVLDDAGITDPKSVSRVIFASGKVAVEADQYRDENEQQNVAVVRVEQLYPWPFKRVAHSLNRYFNAREIVWLQEEPENMGPWNSIKGRLYEAHGDTHRIRRVSRHESGSPATGSVAIHKQEQTELLDRAFGGLD
ncbi:MAG: multifunctional oxoglutarate decarboxylase/oxoglutarate dehydrogenase thiamine pyrophosphate-binding subunit/dihydrolipoyllysine-residue succinyltransferase subunit [Acidimicrobiia bacterium]|nr:multifunctional oxoglutarate decarboxylase/oxoglutarate dehydrogenase thiamine pyrophosphate-binding subunit/dihydrolipoyllysine-residue succinyltransferase subunit [Acidimicrobiia bacterium]